MALMTEELWNRMPQEARDAFERAMLETIDRGYSVIRFKHYGIELTIESIPHYEIFYETKTPVEREPDPGPETEHPPAGNSDPG